MSMYWQEQTEDTAANQPENMVDILFSLHGSTVPLDHAWDLSQQIQVFLPWLTQEQQAGIHLIHVAESGNGWFRPDNHESDILHLSKRTKLILRIPKTRIADSSALCHQQIELQGHTLKIGTANPRKLNLASVLFARYVMAQTEEDDHVFLTRTVAQMKALGLHPKKVLSGKKHTFKLAQQNVLTQSILVADMSKEESLLLQEHGLGEGRLFGFGLFLPHKGIHAVNEGAEV